MAEHFVSGPVLRSDVLDLELDVTSSAPRARLLDQTTGRAWGPVPLAALNIHDRTLRREDRITNARLLAVESNEDALRVTLSAPTYYGVAVTLEFRVVGGELEIAFDPGAMRETAADRSRLFTVEPLPGLMTVRGSGARLILPINGGMMCRPHNKPALRDHFMIYGEQPRWELTPLLPVISACETGGPGSTCVTGLVMLATHAADQMQCSISTDGHGGGSTGMGFCVRQRWVDPIEKSRHAMRLIAMKLGVDPVAFTAKRLRRHTIDDLGKLTLLQRAEESPEVAYQLRSMTIKLFHGMQNRGMCISDHRGLPESHFWNTMSFDEARTALLKLRSLGIDRLYTQSVGWNARGHDGLYPTRFPVEQRLGGERELRDLFRCGEELGYHCNVHDNFQMNIPDSPDWDASCVIHDEYGEPLVRGWWAGGTEYGTWPAALPQARLAGHLQRVKDLGVRGMFYNDYWMAPLEVNYHPQHRGTRSDHQRGMVHVLREMKRIFGSVSTEQGTLPGAVVCDAIACKMPVGYVGTAPKQADWPILKLLDEPAPLWVLALHGLVMHHAPDGPTWTNAMDAIVWGGVARDEFCMRPLPMGGIRLFDDRRAAGLKALHDLCIERFGHLISEEMTHCDLSIKGVVQTRFADGTHVVADYSTHELLINDQAIECPAALMLSPSQVASNMAPPAVLAGA